MTLLWCCIVSACKADGVEFDMDLLTFADAVDVETAMAWAATIEGDRPPNEGDEKKAADR